MHRHRAAHGGLGLHPGAGNRRQLLPLGQQVLQQGAAQFVPFAAGQVARLALRRQPAEHKGRTTGFAQCPLNAGALVGFGGLRLAAAHGAGRVALAVVRRQFHPLRLCAEGKPNRNAGVLPPVQLPQAGQGRLAGGGVLLGAHAEHRAVDLSIVPAAGKAGAGERILQQLLVVGFLFPGSPAGGHRGGHVLGGAQAALDLHAHHAGLHQLGDLIHQRQVLQAQVVALLRAVGGKGQAAGTGTAAPIAAAAAQKCAHVALAAHRHTQRAVDEAFQLNGAFGGNAGDLPAAQLPAENGPGKAQPGQLLHARQAVHAHLGGAVQLQPRGHPFGQSRRGHVLQDHRVRTGCGHRPDGTGQVLHLARVHRGVQGHVHPHAAPVAEGHRVLQGLGGKVACAFPGVEAGKAQIHRVRAAVHGRTQHLLVARRGQNLQRGVPGAQCCCPFICSIWRRSRAISC